MARTKKPKQPKPSRPGEPEHDPARLVTCPPADLATGLTDIYGREAILSPDGTIAVTALIEYHPTDTRPTAILEVRLREGFRMPGMDEDAMPSSVAWHLELPIVERPGTTFAALPERLRKTEVFFYSSYLMMACDQMGRPRFPTTRSPVASLVPGKWGPRPSYHASPVLRERMMAHATGAERQITGGSAAVWERIHATFAVVRHTSGAPVLIHRPVVPGAIEATTTDDKAARAVLDALDAAARGLLKYPGGEAEVIRLAAEAKGQTPETVKRLARLALQRAKAQAEALTLYHTLTTTGSTLAPLTVALGLPQPSDPEPTP